MAEGGRRQSGLGEGGCLRVSGWVGCSKVGRCLKVEWVRVDVRERVGGCLRVR